MKRNLIVKQDRVFIKRMRREKPLGVPISNVGYTAKMQVRDEYGDVIDVLTIYNSNILSTRIELGGADGTINIRIGADDTAKFEVNKIYVYDLVLVEIADQTNIISIIDGKILIEPAVTII